MSPARVQRGASETLSARSVRAPRAGGPRATLVMSAPVTAFYDKLARGEVRSAARSIDGLRRQHNDIKRQLIERAVRLVPGSDPLAVLDLCCGRGGDLWKLRGQPRVQSVVAVDASRDSLKELARRWDERGRLPRGRRHDLRLQWSCGDAAEELAGMCDGNFGVVLLMFCMGYLCRHRAGAERLLREAHRALCPGGVVALTVVDSEKARRKLGTRNEVCIVEPTQETGEGAWGRGFRFTLLGENAGVEAQVEWILPHAEFVELAREAGFEVALDRQFRDWSGWRRLSRPEREASDLYRGLLLVRSE